MAKPSVDIHIFKLDRSHLFILFCRRSPKTISARTILNSNQQLIGLSYMTTRRSPVGQSREEDKDQELILNAARLMFRL